MKPLYIALATIIICVFILTSYVIQQTASEQTFRRAASAYLVEHYAELGDEWEMTVYTHDISVPYESGTFRNSTGGLITLERTAYGNITVKLAK